jgi:lysylphosphatidylglycerol synthetase-like protein (DUF2156 family)
MSQQPLSELVKEWGSSASVSLLDPRCKIFTSPSLKGAVGYFKEQNNAVVFGDPVCRPEDKVRLAEAFQDYCKQTSTNYIYLAASESFSKWAMNNGHPTLLEIEEELILDPANYPKKGHNGRLLHKKINHAKHFNVIIKEYNGSDPMIKEKIIEVEKIWLLKKRTGPQIYMSHINFFDDKCGKRCFYAEQNGSLVGAIFLTRMEAYQGWLLYQLMTVPDAPGGTSESLVLTVLDTLTEENCRYFSFGVAARKKIGDIIGLSPFSSWIARLGFLMAKKIFALDNRRNFWEKFEPNHERSFILLSQSSIGFREIRAIMKTLNASLY